MANETLQKDLTSVCKKMGIFYTRLRTPSYGYKGVRYPADFILWLPNETFLVECKQRKKLPLAPSDIRQLKYMKEWEELDYIPRARYLVLTATEEGYSVFTHEQAVEASVIHKGLRVVDAVFNEPTLFNLIEKLKEI